MKVPNVGGKVPEGANVDETTGPGTATLDENGDVIVTIKPGAKPGDTVTVIVRDDSGKEIGHITVTVTEPNTDPGTDPGENPGSSDGSSERCVATGLAVGLPLLLLIPAGLAAQVRIPGLDAMQAQLARQWQEFNIQTQKQLGIFNPEVASQIEQANRQLAAFNAKISPEVRQLGAGVALVAAGLLLGGLVYNACAPGGGSSTGSSAGSSQQ